MNELELHNLVRDSLSELKPAYDVKHWRQMQAKLILAPVSFPWKLLTWLAPVAIGGALWWYASSTEPLPQQPATKDTPLKVEPAVTASPLYTPPVAESLDLAPVATENATATSIRSPQDLREVVASPRIPSVTALTPQFAISEIQLPSFKTFFLEAQIKSLLLDKTIIGDSTTFNALERNKNNWNKAAVVCDWTSSMFPYGTQIFTWLDQNQHNNALMGYLFFNDCDYQGNPLDSKKLAGGMYHTTAKDPHQVLQTMITAVRHGTNNSDLQENDLEALLFTSQLYQNAEELVLIADNVSPVRYPGLIEKIDKPVRIIICGSTMTTEAIQPIYLKLAKATGGSIHTIEDDLEDLNAIPDGKWIRVGDTYFKYKKKEDQFIPSNRRKRPR